MDDILTKPKAVIFDWDNTLLDTLPILEKALNTTLLAFGMEPWSRERVVKSTHHSLRDSFPVLFGGRWEEACDIFYAAYDEAKVLGNSPLPGSKNLLKLFAAHGIYMAIVSNKNGEILRAEVASLGWTDFFSKIVGSADCVEDKPSAVCVDAALSAFDESKNARSDVWFIGDTSVDAACARNAGCRFILVGSAEVMTGVVSFLNCGDLVACAERLLVKK